jgi:hypothetical protein
MPMSGALLVLIAARKGCPMLLSRRRAAGRGPNGPVIAFGAARLAVGGPARGVV